MRTSRKSLKFHLFGELLLNIRNSWFILVYFVVLYTQPATSQLSFVFSSSLLCDPNTDCLCQTLVVFLILNCVLYMVYLSNFGEFAWHKSMPIYCWTYKTEEWSSK